MRRIWAVIVLALILCAVPALGLVASADEGTIAPTPRPPESVLRHVDAPRASAASAQSAPRRELVVIVGGYQSCPCQDDPLFAPLRSSLEAAGYEVVQFGQDARFPYDTYGHIAPNAARLRDEIRALSPGFSSVHIVAHSMGGVVADQAFAQGLGAADGVATYTAIASPHSGSDAARMIEAVRAATGEIDPILRDAALLARIEPSSDAVRDLATVRPIAPPRGVVRLDLRAANDVLVSGRDAQDPGVESRVLAGYGNGHGDILLDPEAVSLTVQTIVGRRVPPDARARDLAAAAARQGSDTDNATLIGLCLLGGLALLLGVTRWRRPVVDRFISWLPWPSRPACP